MFLESVFLIWGTLLYHEMRNGRMAAQCKAQGTDLLDSPHQNLNGTIFCYVLLNFRKCMKYLFVCLSVCLFAIVY